MEKPRDEIHDRKHQKDNVTKLPIHGEHSQKHHDYPQDIPEDHQKAIGINCGYGFYISYGSRYQVPDRRGVKEWSFEMNQPVVEPFPYIADNILRYEIGKIIEQNLQYGFNKN